MNEIDTYAKVLWNYHHMNHTVLPAEVILCFTSLDLSVPKYVAELLNKGLAPFVVISGKNAVTQGNPGAQNIQQTNWGKSEAEMFCDVLRENGISEEKVFLETEATNSEQNVKLSYRLFEKLGKIPRNIILVHKPTMERRAYATFLNFWPEKDFSLMVTSAPYSYEEYVGPIIDREVIINIMVGDLQRIKEYPAKRFQIYQEIPKEVNDAYEELCKRGYTKHLIR